ncbi:hypothetical protein [Maricaulis sp.]|uniref:hypothetical protein n=1 Tax=Maricaulis sp. TaxID=1486257 RepID=UPI003A8CC9B7
MNRQAASLAIRADGDTRLGLGHVMRCAALADALVGAGHRVIWLSRTPDAIPAELAARIEISAMAPDTVEADSLVPALAALRADGLIGDWQATDPALCRHVRRAGIWLALVGNHLAGAEADIVIHQRFAADTADDTAGICDGAAHLLLSPGYADLPVRAVKPEVKRLLISLGGSETAILDRVLDALRGMPELAPVELDVRRAGARATALPDTGLLDALCAADLAILAAGTTLHEAAATGLAAIALPITGNQSDRARQYQALGLGVSLDPTESGFETRVRETVAGLLNAAEQRQSFSAAGQATVDGHGARRVAARIGAMISRAPEHPDASLSTAIAGPPS